MSGLVVVIAGPTAVGKTRLSEYLAEHLPLEIISADSRQIYRHLDIGTAKADSNFRNSVPHHFVDICAPGDYFSAGRFSAEARRRVAEIFDRNRQPLVVGGSGFYISALIDGIFEIEARDPQVRENLEQRLHSEGLAALYRELVETDTQYAAKINANDKQRILRALEVKYITGRPFSFWHEKKTQPADFQSLMIGLTMDRRQLYRRINERVDAMLDQGLIEEVKKLKAMGYDPQINALNTVGYKEIFAFLNGAIDYDTMVELIKRNSRRYAKRQLTWFRRDERMEWHEISGENDLRVLAGQLAERIKKAGE